MAKFIWHELSTTDPDAAAVFYGSVIGWQTRAYEHGGDYLNFIAGDQGAGGLRKLSEMETARGPWWAGYIGVPDVDEEAQAIVSAGGAVHVVPQDIPTVGRFAVVADPQGGVFMLLAPFPRDDAPLPPRPFALGHAVWHELQTSDWQSAFDFYVDRFGWAKDSDMDMGPMGTYRIFTIDGMMAGGMMNAPLPEPLWLHYFHVADIDVAGAAITAGGGTITHGPQEIPGGGFTIQAIDPQGAVFAITGARQAAGE